MDDNMDDNIAIWTITWTITCYSTANSKGEYTAAQSQSIKISRRPITGLCCFCREVEEFGLKRTFLFFLKTSHTRTFVQFQGETYFIKHNSNVTDEIDSVTLSSFLCNKGPSERIMKKDGGDTFPKNNTLLGYLSDIDPLPYPRKNLQ